MTLTEMWTYCGLRNEGKDVHWLCPNGERMSFKATKNTKAGATGSVYEVHNVKRGEDGTVESASFGMKKWIKSSDELCEVMLKEWSLKDQVAKQAINRKKTINKINKENVEDIGKMTLDEIQRLAIRMNRSERTVLASIVMRRLL